MESLAWKQWINNFSGGRWNTNSGQGGTEGHKLASYYSLEKYIPKNSFH